MVIFTAENESRSATTKMSTIQNAAAEIREAIRNKESKMSWPLPNNIQPHFSTTSAWDNIDRLEATLSGEGTSHRVNGIAVQARHLAPSPLLSSHLGSLKVNEGV